jgi:hypothetical protein
MQGQFEVPSSECQVPSSLELGTLTLELLDLHPDSPERTDRPDPLLADLVRRPE